MIEKKGLLETINRKISETQEMSTMRKTEIKAERIEVDSKIKSDFFEQLSSRMGGSHC